MGLLNPEMLMLRKLYLFKSPGCCPVCGTHWFNDWRSDVRSWMRPNKLPEYYDLIRSGKTGAGQQAHKMIKSSHCSYCFYLAGSKYLLQMLLKLPILAQCSARKPEDECYGGRLMEVPALGRWIADLQNHQESDEYRCAVQKSEKRSNEQRRLSQQICKLSRELTAARTLAIRRDNGEWHDLTHDEQGLVEAWDAGKIERRLQNLAEASIGDLQKNKKWWQCRC